MLMKMHRASIHNHRDLFDEKMIYMNECLTECYEAIDDGSTKDFFLVEASNGKNNLIEELLLRVKTFLLGIIDKIIDTFSKYLITSSNTLEKMRKTLLEIPEEHYTHIYYEHYTYPLMESVPKIIKKRIPGTDELDILFTEATKRDSYSMRIEYEKSIDKNINEFASEVVGKDIKITIDDDITTLISDTVDFVIKGPKKEIQLTKNNINKIVDDIIDMKKYKTTIKNQRTLITEYYEKLRTTMNRTYRATGVREDGRFTYEPSFRTSSNSSSLTSDQVNNLTYTMVQNDRMYNAYITIYRSAFNTKLKIISDMIEVNRKLIRELMKVVPRNGEGEYVNTSPDKVVIKF